VVARMRAKALRPYKSGLSVSDGQMDLIFRNYSKILSNKNTVPQLTEVALRPYKMILKSNSNSYCYQRKTS
jgi:hypothetical protein